MRVYRISKCDYINDLSGTGASLFSGRWHSKGTFILYSAANSSLALLETIVHTSPISLPDFCMICLDIPELNGKEIKADELLTDWRMSPPPDALKKIGDDFIAEKKYLYLKIPSAIMPEDHNYLINPLHPDFSKIKVVYIKEISIDQRVIQTTETSKGRRKK